MSYKLAAYGQRMFVKRLAENEVKGILVPEKYKKIWMVGKVLHAGPDCVAVKDGDTVLFAKYSGVEIPVDSVYVDERYNDTLVMNEPDILGFLEEEGINLTEASATAPQLQEVPANG